MKKKKDEFQRKMDALSISEQQANALQADYVAELNTNPKYSLEPDPTGDLQLTVVDKEFINYYVQFKNVNTVAQIMKLNQEAANELFIKYDIQQEIRRINAALYQRQFASKLLSLDEIGGYLSSLLTDTFVPLADQLKPMEKLRVVDTLLKITELKRASIVNPTLIMAKDIDIQLKDLSVETIKNLLAQTTNVEHKNEIIEEIDEDNVLTVEEKAYLESLPTKELLKLVDDTNKAKLKRRKNDK